MFDGFNDFALEYCANDHGRQKWPGIVIRLILLYLVLAGACWTESQFRSHGIDVEAKIEVIGVGPKETQLVRYTYPDPTTNLPRMNTVTLGRGVKVPGAIDIIEYIPGEYPTSRLKIQARPLAFSLFAWLNVIYAGCVMGFLWYLARQANRPIRRRPIRRSN